MTILAAILRKREKMNDRVFAMWADGRSVSCIAEKLHVDHDEIHRILWRHFSGRNWG